MKDIKRTILTEQDLNVIKDIYENSECYNFKELYRMILDQFESEDLEYELLENGICCNPECLEEALISESLYDSEDSYRSGFITICEECGRARE